MGQAISKLTIKGFKSIRNLENFELRNINILIGPNGSGKSNFVSFLNLLQAFAQGTLSVFVDRYGGANSLLFFGSKTTDKLIGDIIFRDGNIQWKIELVASVKDTLVTHKEVIKAGNKTLGSTIAQSREITQSRLNMRSGNEECKEYEEEIAVSIQAALKTIIIYHFHDTSTFAGIKKYCSIRDYEYLRPDASNLAAFLWYLKKNYEKEYQMIREVTQLAAPFFDDFLLRESIKNPDETLLEWRQKGSDYPFHPSQISDGTLRFICLATALLQSNPPSTILLDEPELGLHPFALALLAELIQKASLKTQIIVATQSAALIDHFQPEDIILVERKNDETIFDRPDTEKLKIWLEDYSLGDIWSRNIIEGKRPANE
jgi:predicted ATPase